jgi:hypothetical protein
MEEKNMEIVAGTLLSYPVAVDIDSSNPCAATVEDIDVQFPVRVVWVLPPGYQFTASGVSNPGGSDFEDGRFDGPSRRRFRWTARRPGSGALRTYSLSYEWIDPQGVLRSCVVPDLKIINRS